MLIFNLINSIIGLALAIFGYMIRFRGRLDLINSYKEGTLKDEDAYAYWIGNSELFCGLALIALGFAGFTSGNTAIPKILDPIVILLLVALLFIGEKRYGKVK